VDVSGGVAGDPVDHVNLLKVFFSSEIASAMCALSAATTGFVFISWACCFCSILDEVARAKKWVFTAKSVTYRGISYPKGT
jgi:hypothetical protein